ncbi:kinase-like domain-containing protein, partial [Lentinula raphanica]
LKEINIIGDLRLHASIVKLLGVAFIEVKDEVKPSLILELALGNLSDFFLASSSVESQISIPWELVFYFATDVCLALVALHDRQIIHADVKSQNILIFPSGVAKLSDFG